MSLRVKVAILSTALLAGLLVVLTGVLWGVVRPTFEEAEQVNARERMMTVMASLESEKASLRRLTRDWASRSGTYAAVLPHDSPFETTDLVRSTFTQAGLHSVGILDRTGRTLWSITLDRDRKTSMKADSDSATRHWPVSTLPMEALSTSKGVTGFIPSPQGPLLASVQPILNGNGEGPAPRVLIMTRRLQDIVSNHISLYSGIDLTLWPKEQVGGETPAVTMATPPSAQARALMVPGSGDQSIQGIGDGTEADITVAHRLDGLDGAPLAVVTITLPKRFERQGVKAIQLAILVTMGGGLLVILAFWYATNRAVLDPIGRLQQHITDITRTGDLDTPLNLDQPDEIGALARSFETLRGRIRYLIHNDPLTGLPNRELFLTLAERSLTLAREDGGLVAVAFIDIDRFKTINDSLGQENGDALLTTVARRLLGIAGKSDLVARYGGDEFLMLLGGLETPLSARNMASRLINAFEHPFSIGDQSIYITASLGLALFPRDSDNLAILISHSNAAMNHAKALGRNNFQFFDGEVNIRAREILAMEGSLRQALSEDRLELHYQPQVDARSGRLVGLEALVRWNHPDRGLVAAEDFLPFVEQSGLHATLDRWVLETACRQSRVWRDQGLPVPKVAINLSARHFESDDLYDFISGTLNATGADPKDLAIEITETVMMRTSDRTQTLLNRLRSLGFQVVIDDFGTGFASLSYLRDFPLDRLKIDKTFVGELPGNKGDSAIVRAVLALARELGLDILAEGVERQDQADWLVEMGCPIQQGYLHGHPLSAEALEGRLTTSPEWLKGGLDHTLSIKDSPQVSAPL